MSCFGNRIRKMVSFELVSVMFFGNRIRKMVSFELDKDVEKGVFSLQWALLTLESLWYNSSIGV